MIGAQTSLPLWTGMFSASLEYVKTDPWLYLRWYDRYGETSYQPAGTKGINFVVAQRYTFGKFYKEDFLGYRWGGDASVLNAHAAFRVPGKWNVAVDVFYMQHGTHDKWTTYTWIGPDVTREDGGTGVEWQEGLTTEHQTGNHADPNASARNAIRHQLACSVVGAWDWTSHLTLFGQVDFVTVWNPGNIKADAPVHDIQFTVGVTARY
jgi:hypothetical protein